MTEPFTPRTKPQVHRFSARAVGLVLLSTGALSVASCGGANAPTAPEQPSASTPSETISAQAASSGLDDRSVSAASTAGAASSATPSTSAEAMQPPVAHCADGTAFVAGGSFQRAGTRQPKQLVDLCVDVLETTVAQYGQCVTAGQCTTTGLDCSAQATWNKAGKEQQPVVCVEYDQAQAYCAHRGKRLPTIEEWEWVARSGDEARTYTWGSEAPNAQLCWTGKQRQTESCVVGTHPEDRSASGVLDLAGNVLEFVTTERDTQSPLRIAKGGAWNGGDPGLFTNTRLGGFRKEYRCGFLGIRCVQEAPATTPSEQ